MRAIIVAGDKLDFLNTDASSLYPATAGWTLKYSLVPRDSTLDVIAITASAEGADYRVSVLPSTTSGWSDSAGQYSWYAWVEKSGDRRSDFPNSSGFVTIAPDPSIVDGGYDGRSLARKALDDAKAALANFSATSGRVKRYSIAGREMEFDAASDILVLVDFWKNEVAREAAAKAAADGLPSPRRIFLRGASAR